MTADVDRRRVARQLADQAEWCGRLGSPLYQGLLECAADNALAGGPVWSVLAPHASDPSRSMLALRFMGAIHRIVLEGRAASLARHYPSTGGQASAGVRDAFLAIVRQHGALLQQMVRRPVQTNEVGRSAALLGGFLTVATETALPLALLEVGASAGLNLRWDRYFYETRTGAWGDPASDVRFTDFLVEGRLPLEVTTRILERRGCDAHPIDPTTRPGRLTLLSFVWPDQVERLDRLRGALKTAARVPASVDRADAASWLGSRLRPVRGSATVVFHSVVWQYLGHEGRERVRAVIEASGGAATHEAPVAWLRLKPGGNEAKVRMTLWPPGDERLLARSGFHGRDVRWLAIS